MRIAGRYEIDELPLGRGGMGAVHPGHDTHLDRRVAVKFLHVPGGSDEQRERFVREARILARLEHPGVPALYDLGTHEQRLFQVMQFVDGVAVDDVVAELGPLPPAWVAAIAAQTCAVLAAAHGLAITHRDLEPSNLMLRTDGSVVVLDFGLAVLAGAVRFSRVGQLFGTPSYMAPEQIQHGVADPRSDLYALGCVLHELPPASSCSPAPRRTRSSRSRCGTRPHRFPACRRARRGGGATCSPRTPQTGPPTPPSCTSGSPRSPSTSRSCPASSLPNPGPGRRYACVWGRTI